MLALTLGLYTEIAVDGAIAVTAATTGGLGVIIARETFRSIKKKLEAFRKHMEEERELEELRKDIMKKSIKQ